MKCFKRVITHYDTDGVALYRHYRDEDGTDTLSHQEVDLSTEAGWQELADELTTGQQAIQNTDALYAAIEVHKAEARQYLLQVQSALQRLGTATLLLARMPQDVTLADVGDQGVMILLTVLEGVPHTVLLAFLEAYVRRVAELKAVWADRTKNETPDIPKLADYLNGAATEWKAGIPGKLTADGANPSPAEGGAAPPLPAVRPADPQ